jgi:DNA processing protein
MDEAERIDWLRLARAESVGPVTFAHLIGRYGAASRALSALPDLARRGGRSAPPRIPSVAEAKRELEAGAALGARLLTLRDPAFPRLLAALDPPPPLLWVLGDETLLERRAIGMVGAREASSAGQRMARSLAAGLGQGGYVVVSGLARGIDASAHQGALPTGTIAVLAGGVDSVWPPQNAELYQAIKAKGCIVSERPVGYEARAPDFPRRNRLISGLSLGVVVVEAEVKSGSLITARLAGEQGRDVFAVPGSPLDPRARGTNDLIRQGAWLVEEADDVLRVLNDQPSVSEPEPTSYDAGDDDGDTEPLIAALETLLSHTPTAVDELARSAGAPISLTAAALMELALAGRAELLPGGFAVRV